jgi:tetratricopeptide (TPR) repeat protein
MTLKTLGQQALQGRDAMNPLEEAYRLIQAEQLDKALAILQPITRSDPNNADAWWLLANAVSEPEDAYEALTNVIRLDPTHTEAQELLDNLLHEFPVLAKSPRPVSAASDPLADLDFGTPSGTSNGGSAADLDLDSLFKGGAPSTSNIDTELSTMYGSNNTQIDSDLDLDDLFANTAASSKTPLSDDPFSDDVFKDKEPDFLKEAEKKGRKDRKAEKAAAKAEKAAAKAPAAVPAEPTPLDPLELEQQANRRRGGGRTLLIALLIVVIGGAGLFFLLPTLQAPAPDSGTSVAGNTGGNTSDAGSGEFRSLEQKLGVIGFSNNTTVTLADGVLTTEVCSTPSRALQDKVYQIMDVIALEAAVLEQEFDSAALRVTSCGNANQVLYNVAAPRDAILAYTQAGMQDKRTFRAAWARQ